MRFGQRFIRQPRHAILLASALVTLLCAQTTQAQTAGYPHIPIDTKGYQANMMRFQYFQQMENARAAATHASVATPAHAAHTAAPTDLLVTVQYGKGRQRPDAPALNVAVRGPDGKLQSFPVVGGSDAITIQSTVVRPGEAVTIQIKR